MKTTLPIAACILMLGCGPSESAETPTDTPTDPTAIAEQAANQDALANELEQPLGEYPRERDLDGNRLIIHAPQIRRWDDFERFEAWLAIEFTPAETGEVEYGTAIISGATAVDLDARLVRVSNPAIDSVQFADRDIEDTSAWEAIVSNAVVRKELEIPVDLFLAYLADGAVDLEPTPGLNPDPPIIIVSTSPALLLFVDGEPVFAPIEETGVDALINANWPLLRAQARLYLLNEDQWLSAADLEGPWAPTRELPQAFASIPVAPAFEAIHAAVPPPQAPEVAPRVIVASEPTELILIGGEPQLVEIEETGGLEYVANTTSPLFRFDEQWYYLVSGRWFGSADLEDWELLEGLPEAFRLIPPEHAMANVRASVPGTPEAKFAVLEAALPTETTVALDAAPEVTPTYAGEPELEPLGSAGVQRIRNSGYDVFLFEGRYYWCHAGVWYVSVGATGPWTPATHVPAALYQIPPGSPGYNNTYVKVAESTSTSVTYVYTSGYSSVYYGYGVPVYGTGWYYRYPYYGYYYRYPRSYGYGRWYNPNTGRYGSVSSVYGPYGGYSYARAYNPRSGRYGHAESAWYGDEWAMHGETYNPRTGVYSHTDRYYDDDRDMAETERTFQRGDDWMTVDRRIDTKNNNVEISRETSGGGSVDAYRDFDGEGGMTGSGTVTTRDGRTVETDSSFQRGEGGSVDISGSDGGSGTITRDADGTGSGSFTRDGKTVDTSTERRGANTRTDFETSTGAQGTSVSRGDSRATVAKDSGGDLYAGHNGNVYKRTDDGWQQRQNGQWQQTGSAAAGAQSRGVADYSKQLEAAKAQNRTRDAERRQAYGGGWEGNRSQLNRDHRARASGNQRYQQRRSSGARRSMARRGGGRRGRR